jgi:ubiquinone/menaquinone biosynthesis C-methylase UbiE
MSERVCPWWIGYLLASPLRRWLGQDPGEIVGPYVKAGMTVLEPGPGMGFFTLEMAQRVGETGRVVAVDVQPRMLAGLRRRAARANLSERIDARLAHNDSLALSDLANQIDFVLAFAVVHEMPSAARFFEEAARAMKPGACLLFAEPRGHVKPAKWEEEIALAAALGLRKLDEPPIRRSLAAVMQKAT